MITNVFVREILNLFVFANNIFPTHGMIIQRLFSFHFSPLSLTISHHLHFIPLSLQIPPSSLHPRKKKGQKTSKGKGEKKKDEKNE